jgi:aldose 1-epimerase
MKSEFGKLESGETVHLYTLQSASGMEVKITNFGGIITSIRVPDKNDTMGNVVLGFDSLEDYTKFHPYFGALVGRYANRIGGGLFKLDGMNFSLAQNNGQNSLHGGIVGFDKKLWKSKEFENESGVGVELEYMSPDGEEGYPGNMNCKVIYTLTNDNELKIQYQATTDKTTVINLTNHSYFNLKDGGESTILDHEVVISSNQITPTDEGSIPTGELMEVEGTPFDFREPHTIGERIESDHQQIQFGGGYDHNYVLEDNSNLKFTASAYEPQSGRFMEVYTTEPGVQLYTGNFLGTAPEGAEPPRFEFRTGFCLETQHFPDSPNRPEFPSVVLNPGNTFESTTVYKFSVKKD